MFTEKKYNILIVDDEPVNVKILLDALKGEYRLIAVKNGNDALESINANQPDLILLDILMPDIDGFEILNRLKSDRKTSDIPVIFITAAGRDDYEAKGIELGAVDFITKPFNPATIKARVRLHLELKRYRDHLEKMVYERTEKLIESNKRLREEIGEKRRVEEQLRLQTTALEAAANAVVITDVNGTILWINRAFSELTGYLPQEAVGNTHSLLKSGKQGSDFYHNMWETITSGGVWHGKLTNRRNDGILYIEEMTITPVKDMTGKITHFIAIKRDITHEIERAKRIQQARKLEAIGTLAGGIAHDFNNILYAILGYTELAMDDIPKESTSYHCLEYVKRAGKRAADLVSQILTFSRQDDQKPHPMLIAPVLKEAIKLLRGCLPSTIEICKNIDETCGAILGNATQIHQVVMNLCINAYHAMQYRGGILTVGLSEIDLDDSLVLKHPSLKPGRYIKLTVQDTGHGMNKKTMARIFEPFYTEKKIGEGAGLGLSTVYGIVEAHNGSIYVDSELGRGSIFDILFPLCSEQVDMENEEEVKDEPVLYKGSERILLVDDDEMIIRMLDMKLKRHGYEVKSCTSSREALEIFRAAPERYDAVILDQIMPQLTGIQLAARLLRICPKIPIILCTAYTEITTEKQARTVGIRGYIQKPITNGELMKILRNMLDEKIKKSVEFNHSIPIHNPH